MKNFKLLLFVCALLPNIAWAGSNIEKTNNGISFVTQGMDFKIEFYTDDIVRVHKTPTRYAVWKRKSGSRFTKIQCRIKC